eukprot:558458-Hanusia_phi.AAC.5
MLLYRKKCQNERSIGVISSLWIGLATYLSETTDMVDVMQIAVSRAEQLCGEMECFSDLSISPSRRSSLRRVGNYVLGDELGEGSFGKVKEGLVVKEGSEDFGMRVAVKIISRKSIRKVKQGEEKLRREIRCVRSVKHKNVIQLLDVIGLEEGKQVYLVFELANLFSIQDLLEAHALRRSERAAEEGLLSRHGLPSSMCREIFAQMMSGVSACHSKGIAHRDIKPSNLLLSSDGLLKLVDFGSAERIEEFTSDLTQTVVGTPEFQPPEAAQGLRFSMMQGDLWAAGVTLYVLLEEELPFQGDSIEELYANIAAGKVPVPAHWDEQVKELVTGMLRASAEERLSLRSILHHPWVQQRGEDCLLSCLERFRKKRSDKSLLRRYIEQVEEAEEEEANISFASSCSSSAGDLCSSIPLVPELI